MLWEKFYGFLLDMYAEFVKFVLRDSCDLRSQYAGPQLIETLISRVDHNNHEVRTLSPIALGQWWVI